MITTNQFSSAHHSFWIDCFPALENYVRLINAGGYERLYLPLNWSVSPARSALVSETAFCVALIGSQSIESAEDAARTRLRYLPGVELDAAPLDADEREAAKELAHRLKVMSKAVVGKSKEIEFNPKFPGCGLLATSFGDIRSEDCLIEIKSVDRTFRSTDFKQLLTYILQDRAGQISSIDYISVINARRGTYFKAKISEFVRDTAASGLQDIENKFFAAVGAGGASR